MARTFHEIVQDTPWVDVWGTEVLQSTYGETPEHEELYKNFYEYLKFESRTESSVNIIVAEFYDEEDDCHYFNVLCYERDSDENEREYYSLTGTPWNEWLGMEVTTVSVTKPITEAETVAHCLYEMTFHGFLPGDGEALVDHINRIRKDRIHDAMQEYDAFISYASEDKDVVELLVEYLETDCRVKVWFDELELTIGDSLRSEIDRGLKQAKFGIVFLSENFFKKNWPQYELDGLLSKELEGEKVILPVWHNISKAEVMSYSPSLANKVAGSTNGNIKDLAYKISWAIDKEKNSK